MKKIKNIIIVIFILIIVFTIILLYFYSNKISPLLVKYSKIESKNIAIQIISKNISDDVIKILNEDNLFLVEKDNNDNIELIDYNTKVVNKILSKSAERVTKNFYDNKKKNDGVIMKIPLGVITNNIFFENLGPRVPVKLVLDGNALTSLKTNVKEYGINSALIEVSVKIEANIDIIIPFRTNSIKVINEVPISIKVVKGNVSSILNTE